MPARVQKPINAEELTNKIGPLFDQAQDTLVNHTKNAVKLYKIHLNAASFGIEGEQTFEEAFFKNVLTIFGIRKGVPQADRVVAFIALYIKHIQEKAGVNLAGSEDVLNNDSTASRFTDNLINMLLYGGVHKKGCFAAKLSSVRYRTAQLFSEAVGNLGILDADGYICLKERLCERLTDDKDSTVRASASMTLCRLPDLGKCEEIVATLVNSLQADPSPEVRRTLVHNIPISLNQHIKAAFLRRAHDKDPTVRKQVFFRLVGKNLKDPVDALNQGLFDPSQLSQREREDLVNSGLLDRDPSVQGAAKSLVIAWLGFATRFAKVEEDEKVNPATQAVLCFLELFNLDETPQKTLITIPSQPSAAALALGAIFESGHAIVKHFSLKDEEELDALTLGQAFLARVFAEFCVAPIPTPEPKGRPKTAGRLEEQLPTLTALTIGIQKRFDSLGPSPDEGSNLVLVEMLKLAVNLDYDEMGRRGMSYLIRRMLGNSHLDDRVAIACLDILKILSTDDRDFIRLVVDMIQAIREEGYGAEILDLADPDSSFDDTDEKPKPPNANDLFKHHRAVMSEQEKIKADMIDLYCLSLCTAMLERVNTPFEDNIHLKTLAEDLIFIAVFSHPDSELKEKGLHCLGLCCLIDQKLGIHHIDKFMNPLVHRLDTLSESLQVLFAQLILDMFMAHERAIRAQGNLAQDIPYHLNVIMGRHDTTPELKTVIGMGLAKLVFARIIADDPVILGNLVSMYFDETNTQELLQYLAMFLRHYSSSSKNRLALIDLFVPVFVRLAEARLVEYPSNSKSKDIVQAFEYWTTSQEPTELQLELGLKTVRGLLEKETLAKITKDDKRILCRLLNGLQLPKDKEADSVKVGTLALYLEKLSSHFRWDDSVAKKSFEKFHTAYKKQYQDTLEVMTDAELRKLEELSLDMEFLDSIFEETDSTPEAERPVWKGNKRRQSDSIFGSEDEDVKPEPPQKTQRKRQTKKPRLSTSDDDESDQDTRPSAPVPNRVPTRSMPKRNATRAPSVTLISSDTDEEETPRRRPTTRKTAPISEPILVPDSDSEDSEDEVQGLVMVDDDD
ncbi:nuclear condensing complex subunit [Mycena floridula]|nr:nuclear condensing complex subunit [Mycena floridula]